MFSIRWRLTIFNAISLLIIVVLMLVSVFAILGVSVQDIVENSTRDRVNHAARVLTTPDGLDAVERRQESDGDIALAGFDEFGTIIYRFGRQESILEGYPGRVAFDSLQVTQGADIELGFDSASYQEDPDLRATLDESYVFAVSLPTNDLGISVIAGTRSYDSVGQSRLQ